MIIIIIIIIRSCNLLSGSKPLETKHDDKPTNVTMTTGSVGWLSRLLQLAIIIAFVGCFQSVYKHVTTMEQRIKELEVKQETSENKINDLEMEIAALHLKLSSVINETQDNRKLLDTTEGGLNKTNTFVKEFYKNFTITNTLTGDHNSSIQYLYNFTDVINETLVRVKDE